MPWRVTFHADHDKRALAVGAATADWCDEAGNVLFSYSERCALPDEKAQGAFVQRAIAARDAGDAKGTAEGGVARAVEALFKARDRKQAPEKPIERGVK